MYNKLFIILILSLSVFACSKDDSVSSSGSSTDTFTNGPVLSDGYTLFSYLNSAFTSIRYSPSIIVNADNSIDAWFTIPGGYLSNAVNYFNQISYIHSDDGKTWNTEQIVLKPSENALDQYYTRNPSVIKSGGYYYLTYESRTNGTTTASGSNNYLYACRATSPSGPWLKWNGTSWGGNPVSIINIIPTKVTYYGVGESSMLVKNDSIYLYYSLGKDSSVATRTVLRKAPANDTLWPLKLTASADTIFKRNIRLSKTVAQYYSSDRVSFKYDETKNTFYAFGVMNRLVDSSYIQMWSSPDGTHFNELGKIKNGTQQYASFIGVSGDSLGHWRADMNKYFCYTFGNASVLLADTYFNTVTY